MPKEKGDKKKGADLFFVGWAPLNKSVCARNTRNNRGQTTINFSVNRGLSPICHAVPGFNAFATLHDQWMISLEKYKGADMNFFENSGSMPPALLVNYGALYDKYRVVGEQTKRNATVKN